ncbi:cyclophilin-like fold protein [Rhizobium rhizoryzae]|uniref:cyclophilin-like fold protein n=1 Tax=Rhizobium rhizoryzae TaxID=451876 RepID=UPI0028A7645F|nr:cyclophilin-like fold protein [Rhizobium rhizoryzae]
MTSLQLHRRTVWIGSLATMILPPLAFGQQRRIPANQEPTKMKVRFSFDRHTVNATLYDNPSARDFASMLPLDLKIEDYSNNEKIAYLPRKLTEEGSGPFGDEKPGDVCYYVPWGNVILFYASYRYSSGLIRLGRVDGGIEPMLTRGEFPLRIESAE